MKYFASLIFTLLMVSSGFSIVAQTCGSIPAELVGSWSEGSASILQEQNMSTGSLTSKYGSSIGYRFNADGTFNYAGLIKSTMYGCTTTLWNDKRGKFTVSGDRITLTPSKDYWFNTYSCASSSNKEKYKDRVEETFEFEVGVVKGKEYLCMRKEGDPKDKISCFPRAKD